MESLPLAAIARRLDLPTSTVERWIRQGRIPIQQRGDQGLFNERELRLWARDHKLDFTPSAAPSAQHPEEPEQLSLSDCIERGGVHFDVGGTDVISVLGEAAKRSPLAAVHHERLAELMVQREELSSTGIGTGVAIPHPRTPLGNVVHVPSVSVCFLEQPLDFAAVDGQPVFVLFVILSPSVKTHLRILARLAYLLRDDTFLELLQQAPPAEQLLTAVTSLQMSPSIASR